MRLLGEVLRLLRRRGKGPLLLSWGLLLLFLGLLDFFMLTSSGLGGEEGVELVALLEPGLLPSQVDRLYLEIREWEEVARVEFIFAEEVKSGLRKVKLPVKELRGDLFQLWLHKPGEVEAVQERLKGLAGIASVFAHGQRPLTAIFQGTPGARWGLLAVLIGFGLFVLVYLRATFRSLIQGWGGELRLLHLSGVARQTMGRPFLLLAMLLGLSAGLVLAGGLYFLHRWGLEHPEALYRSLPALLEPGTALAAALLALVGGLLLALLGGAWSLLVLRRIAP
jgi:cell division protein FtsX